ncbi:MAG: hypothetical protein ACFCUW_01245 [Kiloniellaceae bacterium]
MNVTESRRTAGRIGRLAAALALLWTAALLPACAGAPEASRSTAFDAGSGKAIVVIGTFVDRIQEEGVVSGRSLSTYWVEYDPHARRLVPDGKTFLTRIGGGVLSEPGYTKPTVSVLEIDPGDYALVGAGFPHLMTTYVGSRPTNLHNDSMGRRRSWHRTVDPRVHIDPTAAVDPRQNFLFTALPGQVLYIGHFEFVKWSHSDSLGGINYFQDEAAARKALESFPGITGAMMTYDFAKPPQSVSR